MSTSRVLAVSGALACLAVLPGCGGSGTSNVSLSTPSESAQYKIVGTGQTQCYGNTGPITAPAAGGDFYGQDAQNAGNSASYRNNGDGTISDLATGLMWQQTYENQPHAYADAQGLLSSLNAQKLGGYSDWRLPSIKELYSLWNANSGWPYINTNFFPISYRDEQELGHAIFFSSTRYAGLMETTTSTTPGDGPGAAMVFGVNFGTGHIKGYSISAGAPTHFFRFVRGNTAYGINTFKNNTDGTLSDSATGLMWSQADSGSGMNWQAALAWVQGRNAAKYCGFSDWRLPNAKELQSIVDYSRSPNATTAANVGPAINPLFGSTSITNEAGVLDYPYYWTSTSARFDTASSYDSAWYVAFGRAADPAGKDLHGAGAVRFDKKVLGSSYGQDAERVVNFVRLVRTIK